MNYKLLKEVTNVIIWIEKEVKEQKKRQRSKASTEADKQAAREIITAISHIKGDLRRCTRNIKPRKTYSATVITE